MSVSDLLPRRTRVGPVEALLVRVARGDRDAFAEVYAQFRGRVFGLCVLLVRDRHQAEEVAQEVFLQIWQGASRFDVALGSGTAWILQSARSRAVDRIRHSQASRVRDTNYLARTHATEVDTVTESVLLAEEYAAIRRALALLSPKQRESLTMAYFECLTTPQISDRLGVPVSTVKSRLRDGLLKMNVLIGEPPHADRQASR